jgi:predicted nucleic acid-binding Zn ribbon protein
MERLQLIWVHHLCWICKNGTKQQQKAKSEKRKAKSEKRKAKSEKMLCLKLSKLIKLALPVK